MPEFVVGKRVIPKQCCHDGFKVRKRGSNFEIDLVVDVDDKSDCGRESLTATLSKSEVLGLVEFLKNFVNGKRR